MLVNINALTKCCLCMQCEQLKPAPRKKTFDSIHNRCGKENLLQRFCLANERALLMRKKIFSIIKFGIF